MAGFKIRNVFILGGFAAFLAGLFVISCDVGLGSSVDTQPPTLAIDYPPVAAVVRGGFMLSGTCEDDKGVASVTVSIVDGENKPVGEPRMAEIADGRWTVDINEQELESGLYELPDGKYTFAVVAEDGAGRKSDKLERTLEIDNTFPVFIIKNPGTTNKDSPAAFGSSFKVVGLMAEDHDVSKMIVTVYDASDARQLDEWTEELVETAGGTEVTFARYDKAPAADDDLYKHYAAIYDVDKGGDQFYSCTVTVMDSAKEYRMPETGAPSSEDGNTSLAHFLYDDVYEKYMSALSESRLSVGDIKKILNGTVGAASSADDEEAGRASVPISDADAKGLAEELKKLLTDTSEARLQFKLNKDANPTWEVMGYNVDSDTLALDSNTGSKGGKVTFKASMGLDETYFYPRELKLYLFGLHTAEDIANNWKEMYGDADAWYDGRIEAAKNVYKGSDEELLATEAKAWLLYDGGTQDPNASSTGEFTTSIVLPTITAEKQYIFAASGADMDGLDFVPSTGCYGFVGVASGTPPTISISDVCGNAAPKVVTTVVGPDVPFVIKGTANGRGSTIEEVTYEVTVYDESAGNRVVGTVSGTLDALKGKEDGSWEFNIADGAGYAGCKPVSGKMYKYSTVVYVSNSAGLSSQDNADLRMDAVDPVPRIASVSPVAGTKLFLGRDMNVVNGEILIAISVSDANLSGSKLKYRISEPEESLEDDKGWIETKYSFGANDTYVENIRINTTEYDDEKKLELMLEAEDAAGNIGKSDILPLYVNQESDRPFVASESETSDKLSSDDIAPNKNLFGVTSNNIFKATVTDDDGIGSLTLVLKKQNGEQVGGTETFADAVGKTSYSLSYKLPETEGKYVIAIDVEDTKGETDHCENSYTYNIGIDSANPTLEFTTQNRANTSASEDKVVQGNAGDSSGIKSIKRYTTVSDADSAATGDLDASWPAEDGIDGTINVGNAGVGATNISWTDTIGTDILTKGSGRRRYIVEDMYGNTTAMDFIYYVDSILPEIKTVGEIPPFINGKNIFQIAGTAFDTDDAAMGNNSGNPEAKNIESVRYKIAGKDDSVTLADGTNKYDGQYRYYADAKAWTDKVTPTIQQDGTRKWTATVNLSGYEDGDYMVYFAAFDEAGNQSKAIADASEGALPATQYVFTNDTVAPEVAFARFEKDDDTSEPLSGTSVSFYENHAGKIMGTVKDANLESLKVTGTKIGASGGAPGKIAEELAVDGTSWNYRLETGSYTLTFTATDKAGNMGDPITCSAVIDDTPPEAKLDPSKHGNMSVNVSSMTLQVLVNDNGDDGSAYSSGIKSVTAQIGTNAEPVQLADSGTSTNEKGENSADGTWRRYIGTVSFKDGENVVGITVKDGVDNGFTTETTFFVDATAPKITNFEYKDSTAEESAYGGLKVAYKGDVGVRFTVEEAKLSSVTVTDGESRTTVSAADAEGSGSVKADNLTLTANGNGTYTCIYTLSDEGAHTLKIEAVDAAGNIGSASSGEVAIDKQVPELLFDRTAGSNNPSIAGGVWINSNELTMRVLVSDSGSGIASVEYAVIAGNGSDEGGQRGSMEPGGKRDESGGTTGTLDYTVYSAPLEKLADGEYSVTVVAKDFAGNEKELSGYEYKIDATSPTLSVGFKDSSPVSRGPVQFEGTVEDGTSQVKSLKVHITVEGKDNESSAEDAVIDIDVADINDGSWTYAVEQSKYENSKLKVEFVAADNAGNETKSDPQSVVIDVKSPDVSWPDEYKTDGWTNNNTQTIQVLVSDDDLSGIDTVSYSYEVAGNAEPVKGQLNMGSQRWLVDGKVFTTKQDGLPTYRLWSTSIDGIPDGEQSIRIAAKDAAGNEHTGVSVSFKIDTVRPEIVGEVEPYPTAVGGSTEAVVLSVRASDNGNGSGLADEENQIKPKITVKLNSSKEIAYTLTQNEDGFSLTIPIRDEAGNLNGQIGADGLNTYSVIVYDIAGNQSDSKSVFITSDTVPPTITISAPKVLAEDSKDKLNKTITLSGTITDNTAVYVGGGDGTLQLPILQFSKDGSDWTEPMVLEGLLKGTTVSWTAEFDTKRFYNADAGGKASGSLYVKMTAYDEAGNKQERVKYAGSSDEGEESLKTYVDQNDDRPVIKFTAMDNFEGGWSTSTGSIVGTITDDDKADGEIVQGMWRIDASSYQAGSYPSLGNFNGWTEIPVDDIGSWTVTIDDKEQQGEKTWCFYVIDNKGTGFCNRNQTGDEETSQNALLCPYFQYAKADDTGRKNYSNGITFFVDTEKPAVDLMAVAKGSDSAVPADTDWKTADGAVFSKNNGTLWVKVAVKENVGMRPMPSAEDFASGTDVSVPVRLKIGKDDYTKYWQSTDSDGNSGVYTYLFAIPLSDAEFAAASQVGLEITAAVKDASGLENSAMRKITIDNDAPEVSIISPSQSIKDAVMGAVTIRGIAKDKDYISNLGTVAWAIPLAGTSLDNQEWHEIENIPSSGSFTISLTNSAVGSEGILYYVNAKEGDSLRYEVKEITGLANDKDFLDEIGVEGTDVDNYSGFFKVPIWFRMSDSAGNEEVRTTQTVENETNSTFHESDLYIIVDRDGGKPRVEINTPEEGKSVGGTVVVYGTATDDISVKEVRVQIDVNADGDFNETDYNLIKTEGDLSLLLKGTSSDWYLLADGTNSWKLTIPTGFIDDAQGGSNSELRIRAMARDYDGPDRGWMAVRTAKIDVDAPRIENVKVVQYGKDVTVPDDGTLYEGAILTERAYESGMYISNVSTENNGTWYLTAQISDNQKIDSISYERLIPSMTSGIDLNLEDVNSPQQIKYTDDDNTERVRHILNIPLKTENSGQIYYKITVADDNSGTATQVITINIDSTAPSLYTKAGELKNVSLAGELRLKADGSSDNTKFLGDAKVVANSNNVFTLGDDIVEDGSGFSALAFWFERKKSESGGTKVSHAYDPMVQSSTAESVRIAGDLPDSPSDGTVYLNADGLPALYAKVGRGDENSLTIGSATWNTYKKHIRPRGLIRIAGTYCTIDKSGIDDGKITFTPKISTTFTDVEIILAQVVDNQTVEAQTDGLVDSGSDDGDGMIESIRIAGSTYSWTASFNSNNIPDGPVTVHVTAMDKAGNITTGSVETQVANSRPRIAKVLIGTDLNSSGTIDYDNKKGELKTAGITSEGDLPAGNGAAFGEFSYYSALSSDGKGLAIVDVDMNGKPFKVRNGLVIIPEFVGGNGSSMYYAWADNAGNTPTKKSGLLTDANAKLIKTTDANSALQIKGAGNNGILHNINGDILKEIGPFGGIVLNKNDSILGDQGDRTISFTFWDETEETTPGDDSQWALLNIPLYVSTQDGTKPTAKVKPFHWNSKYDNSIYSTGSAEGENVELFGHIELVDGTGELIGTPEISGKVIFTGTLYDDWLLGSASVSFNNQAAIIAEYVQGEWKAVEDGSLDSLGISEVKVSDTMLSQDGHYASWSIALDTEKALSGKADGPVGQGIQFSVSAEDYNGHNVSASASGAAQTKDTGTFDQDEINDSGWTQRYDVDVVPYVHTVKTSLSDFYKSAPSVYSRTALGRYPLRAGSDFSISGWNLGTSPSVSLLDEASGSEMPGALSASGLAVSLSPSARSGRLRVSVGGIEASNNRNFNDAGLPAPDSPPAFGYNRQPNGVNNDTLNDDLLIDVWEFKNAAVPVNEGAHNVTMKIRPTDGTPGFSYGHDIVYFSMPGYEGNDVSDGDAPRHYAIAGVNPDAYYSHIPVGMNYGGFTYNTFCFDSYGYSYGSAICTDTQKADKSAYFQFFSRESPMHLSWMDQNMNYHNSANASRLDQTSVEILSGSYVTNIDRIQSISMEATISGGGQPTNDNPTYVYIAYYDKSAKQVRFRWGTVGKESDNIDGKAAGSDSFTSRKNYAYGLDDVIDSIYTGSSAHSKGDGDSRESGKDSYITYSESRGGIPIQIIVADNIAGAKPEYQASQGAVGTGYSAGEYVSLSIVGKDSANPVAVVSWYDTYNRQLCMAYNTNPTGSKAWNAVVVDPDGGINVKTAVDKDGGIHFAYYDNMNGSDLKYAYMPRYNSPESEIKRVTVDAYGAVGAKPTIDVVKVGGNWVPYIGYQSNAYLGTSAAAKMAYRVNFDAAEIPEGSNGDIYTGAWETTIVPTGSLPDDDLINIGLHRNSDGTIARFPTGTDKVTYNNIKTGISATLGSFVKNLSGAEINCGVPTLVYGNGTDNPIVAYATKDGPIEMAQKR